MNAGIFRLVFSAVRGMFVAVGELAHANGQGQPTRRRRPRQPVRMPPRFAARPAAFAVWCALGMQPVLATAQATLPITPDKAGAHPVVTSSASGVPIVNIVAPSGPRGVSNNRFTQYNVGTNGVVIANNGQAAQTRIAGWTQANPFLGNTPAKLVLFQVTGGVSSRLLGPAEMAGKAAPFILANPAGIHCSGCGFIHVPRATLTTGVPTFRPDGSLAFDVSQGRIDIGTGGLSGQGTAIDLISRAMAINGQVWADSIQAIAGANQVDYDSGGATAQAAAGETPQLAIDVQALGSMYGQGAVRLIGTEAGVGVHDGGTIDSLTGDINVSASGDVTIDTPARMQSGGHTRIAANRIGNAGNMVAAGSLQVSAVQGIANSGTVAAGSDATLHAASVTNSGLIGAGVDPAAPAAGNVSQPGTLTIDTDRLTSSGALRAGRDAVFNATNAVLDGGSVGAARALTVNAAQAVSNRQGTLSAGGPLSMTAARVDNSAGTMSSNGSAHLSVAGALTNRDGTLAANDTMTIVGGRIDNAGGTIGAVKAALSATASGALDNTNGRLLAAGDVALTASDMTNAGGTIAGARVALDTGVLDNASGSVSANRNLALTAHRIDNRHGTLEAAGALTASTQGGALDNRTAGKLVADRIALHTGALSNDTGLISSGAEVAIEAATVSNQGGAILANGRIDIASTGAVTNAAGQIGGNGDVSIAGAAIDNTAGAMHSGGTLSVSGATLTNADTQGGSVDVSGGQPAVDTPMSAGLQGARVELNTTQALDNTRGQILADRSIAITTPTLVTDAGNIETPGTILLGGLGDFTHAGNLNAGTALNVSAQSIDNRGTMQSAGDVGVAAATTLSNSGKLLAGRDLNARAGGALTNRGALMAGKTASVAAASIANTDSGEIVGNRATNVSASGGLSNAGLIDGGTTAVTAGGTLTNTGRLYGDTVSLTATDIVNEANAEGVGGVIASRGDLDIGASNSLTNGNDALIYAQGDLRVGGALDADGHATGAAGIVTNDGAQIQAAGAISLDADRLNNLNAHFQTSVVTTDTGSQIWFTVPGSTEQYGPDEALFYQINNKVNGFYGDRWQAGTRDDDYFRLVTPSSTYPFSVYGTTTMNAPAQRAFHTDPDTGDIKLVMHYATLPGDPTWALFGVASPAAIPDYVGPRTLSQRGLDGQTPSDITLAGNDAIAFCAGSTAAACAPVNQWVADTAAAYASLAGSVNAYNADFNSRTHESWTAYQVATQTATPVVTASKPGQIVSGGDLTIRVGSGVNDKSQIVAGGQASISANLLDNSQPQAQRIVTASGTATYSHVGSGGSSGGDERKNDVSPYTPAPVVTTIDLPIAAPNPSGASPVKQVASGASAATGAHANDVKTVAAPGSNATVRTVEPNLTLPNNALYRFVTTPGSPFLIQTDPRFANYRTWLSGSDMLAKLKVDPQSVERFIGDGFYQQQLVQQQIVAATGQRFVGDYADNQRQYAALIDAGVAAADEFRLNVGTALTEAQMAALTTDIVWMVNQTVTLPDGSTQTVLVPQVYLMSSNLAVTGTGALIGGKNVDIAGNAVGNSGTIAGRNVTAITANNLTNSGTLAGQTVQASATQDLTNLGGLIRGDSVTLAAGHNLNLASTTQTTHAANGDATRIDRVASVEAGHATLIAGQDLDAQAAVIKTTGDASLAAGRDVNFGAIAQSSSDHVAWDGRNHAERGASVDTGTRIQAGGNATIAAGNDIDTKAAAVSSDGGMTLAAGHDVNLTAGRQAVSANDEHFQKDSGFLSSKTTHTIDTESRTDAVGTMLSGNTVDVTAGHDLIAKGATVAGSGDVNLSAGNNLTITTAETSSNDAHFKQEKKTGFGATGGLSYGSKDVKNTSTDTVQGAQGSLIGSTNGNLNLSAGNDLHVTGSDLVAAQNVTGVGANVIIDASQTNRQHRETQEVKTTGFTLGLSGSIGDALTNAVDQARTASSSEDSRASALHAIAAVGNATTAVAGALGGSLGGKNPSIGLQLSFGTSQSKTTFDEAQTTNNGSSVTAGGTATFVAQSGNVDIVGSSVTANDVLLAAKHQVNLLNATDTDSTRRTNESSNASVGVSVGTQGVGLSASMSKAHGDANSDAVVRQNTHIDARHSATIVSGGDTNIVGATVNANKVIADVGGNLNIASVQDTTTSAARQESNGGGFGISQTGGSASFSHSNGHASGDYAGVNEQSGIQAGDGGFDIAVKGNTDLRGAYIASDADPSKNTLTTGTLTFSDIQNQSSYDAKSSGFSAGAGLGSTGKAKGPGSVGGSGGVTPMLGQHDSGSDSGLTKSAISEGTIAITDGANQKPDLASLNRDTTNLNEQVANTPDLQHLLDKQNDMMNAASAAGQVVAQTIGAVADEKQREAQKEADAAKAAGQTDLAAQYQAEANSWAEGGTNRVVLHTAGGAAIAGLGGGNALGGAAGAGLAAAMAGKLNGLADSIGDGTGSMLVGNIAANVLAGAGGALIGGNSGAFAAANADLYNRSSGNADGKGGTGSDFLDRLGDAFASTAKDPLGALNHALNSVIPAPAGQNPPADPNPLVQANDGNPPATGGAMVTPPAVVCGPNMACAPTPPIVIPSGPIFSSKNGNDSADSSGLSDVSLPMGSKANQFNQPKNPSFQPTRNKETNIGGTNYSGHALDRMQDRGLTPSIIQNVIDVGTPTPSRGGTTVFFDVKNNVSVVTNSSGKVITVKYGK